MICNDDSSIHTSFWRLNSKLSLSDSVRRALERRSNRFAILTCQSNSSSVYLECLFPYGSSFPHLDFRPHDVTSMSEKFWLFHTDPIWCMDGAAGTLCTIQINLCAGTLAKCLQEQPYLQETLEKVLRFEYW